jgi:hypothetical protein
MLFPEAFLAAIQTRFTKSKPPQLTQTTRRLYPFYRGLLLVTSLGTLSIVASEAAFSQSQQFTKQAPPSSGECSVEGFIWVDDCYQNVNWARVPNSRTVVGGYDEGYAYIGTNTINRNGDVINFDFASSNGYIRFAGNCQRQVVAITRATDTLVDPTNFQAVEATSNIGKALNMACTLSEASGANSPIAHSDLTQARIAINGIGPIRVGMTVAEAERSAGLRLEQTSGNSDCALYRPQNGPENLQFLVNEGRIASLATTNPRIQTVSGAHVGNSANEILAMYPDRIQIRPSDRDNTTQDLIFIPRDAVDQDYYVVFVAKNNRVFEIRAGLSPEISWDGSCY